MRQTCLFIMRSVDFLVISVLVDFKLGVVMSMMLDLELGVLVVRHLVGCDGRAWMEAVV